MMKKITVFTLSALLVSLYSPAGAQQTKKIPRIGISSPYAADSLQAESFRQGLKDVGYVEGKNIAIEYRWSEGRNERLTDLAAELVRSRVDLIVAISTLVARRTKEATKTMPIPIVMVSGDAVGTGLVASLAHPGGNVTGISLFFPELTTKRLEILKEVVPGFSRVAVLWDPEGPAPVVAFRETEVAAKALGLQLESLEVRAPNPDFETVFRSAMKSHAAALLVIGNPLINRYLAQIVGLAQRNRLPAMYADKFFVEAGGLMSYGVNIVDVYKRLGVYVDKILKGTKPADLPVEQPTKFEFIINLKTAKALNLTIPPNVLVRADKVVK